MKKCVEIRRRAPQLRSSGPQEEGGVKECILLLSLLACQRWAGWGKGREEEREQDLCGAKGSGESRGRVVAMPGQMPTGEKKKKKNRKNRRGGERGGGSWAMDPVASRDGHRAGQGGEGRGWNWGG